MSSRLQECGAGVLTDDGGAVVPQDETAKLQEIIVNTKVPTESSSEAERKLVATEKVIENGLGDFVAVGEALETIRATDLYKPKFETFEDYCAMRWGMHDKHAYRLINAAKCVKKLKEDLAPKGVTIFPQHESQIRLLVALDEKLWVKAWSQVLADNKDSKITAVEVGKVANSLLPKGKKKKAAKPTNKAKNLKRKLTKIAKMAGKVLGKSSKPTVAKLKKVLAAILALIDKGKD